MRLRRGAATRRWFARCCAAARTSTRRVRASGGARLTVRKRGSRRKRCCCTVRLLEVTFLKLSLPSLRLFNRRVNRSRWLAPRRSSSRRTMDTAMRCARSLRLRVFALTGTTAVDALRRTTSKSDTSSRCASLSFHLVFRRRRRRRREEQFSIRKRRVVRCGSARRRGGRRGGDLPTI